MRDREIAGAARLAAGWDQGWGIAGIGDAGVWDLFSWAVNGEGGKRRSEGGLVFAGWASFADGIGPCGISGPTLRGILGNRRIKRDYVVVSSTCGNLVRIHFSNSCARNCCASARLIESEYV